MTRSIFLGIGVVVLFFIIVLLGNEISSAQIDALPPAMTATAMAPTPTPIPTPSDEAQKALRYLSEQEGILLEDLRLLDEYPVDYPHIGRRFQSVTVQHINVVDGQTFVVLVDVVDDSIEGDVNTVVDTERAAYLAKYGALHPSLYNRLQELAVDEILPVVFWLRASPEARANEELFSLLAQQYPEAAEAMERGATLGRAEQRPENCDSQHVFRTSGRRHRRSSSSFSFRTSAPWICSHDNTRDAGCRG